MIVMRSRRLIGGGGRQCSDCVVFFLISDWSMDNGENVALSAVSMWTSRNHLLLVLLTGRLMGYCNVSGATTLSIRSLKRTEAHAAYN
jgi:hypothetical protein